MPAYKEMSYDKLLLNGMRLVSYRPGEGPLTNEGLVKAMTMNENLKTLGYTLTPKDIIKIAQSPSVDDFYDHVKAQMSSVMAKPMYPDFPTQVMEMDEAQYRMHQAVHYFSTYGLEMIGGMEVSKGWLPAEDDLISDTEKTEEDTTLLDARAIELIPEKEKFTRPFEQILSKRERMTDMEKDIIRHCVASGELDFNRKYDIPFKENLRDTFIAIAEAGANGDITRQEASKALYNICQHPGDVTKNLHHYLAKNHYNLRTTEKKMFVSLYDKYSDAAFKSNLVVSRNREKFTKEIFRHIGYTRYTKDQERAEAVRNIGKERTWEAKARDMITSHDPEAIQFAAQRPGMLIRMTSMALKNGYSEKEITDALSQKSRDVSVQTLVSQICRTKAEPSEHFSVGAINKQTAVIKNINEAQITKHRLRNKNGRLAKSIDKRIETLEEKAQKIRDKEQKRIGESNDTLDAQNRIFTHVLKERLSQIETGLEGKTVCLDTNYDLAKMNADPAKKSKNQAYLPSRTAMKIPDGVKRIRCFVYWNDKKRVDLDLHAFATDGKGREIHIGWDSDYESDGMVMSGDITHSNAAEYIDIDLGEAENITVNLGLNSYTGQHFCDIDTCYVGIMAVDKIGQDVKLYDPKNCFESKDITNDCTEITIGQLVTNDRTLYFIGEEEHQIRDVRENIVDFSIKEYLELLVEAQGGKITEDPEKADAILVLTKPENEKEVSLIDNNYFYDAKPKETDEPVRIAENEKQMTEEGVEPEDIPHKVPEDTPVITVEGTEPAAQELIFATEFTKVLIAENALEAARDAFDEEDGRTVVAVDPETKEVFAIDGENPDKVRAEGKDVVKAVMNIEEKAALKDYARVMHLIGVRKILKDTVDRAMAERGDKVAEKNTGTR